MYDSVSTRQEGEEFWWTCEVVEKGSVEVAVLEEQLGLFKEFLDD